jgi:hypothetical protein
LARILREPSVPVKKKPAADGGFLSKYWVARSWRRHTLFSQAVELIFRNPELLQDLVEQPAPNFKQGMDGDRG